MVNIELSHDNVESHGNMDCPIGGLLSARDEHSYGSHGHFTTPWEDHGELMMNKKTLVLTNIANWKITMLQNGKS